MASDPRQTYRWRVLVADLRARGLLCWVCKQPIDYTAKRSDPDGFEADHVYPVSTHSHLAFEPANIRASHVRCNRSRGNAEPVPEGAWVRSRF